MEKYSRLIRLRSSTDDSDNQGYRGTALEPVEEVRNHRIEKEGETANADSRSSNLVIGDAGSRLGFQVALFIAILGVGAIFSAVVLFLTADIGFKKAVYKVGNRLVKSITFRQTVAIVAAMLFVNSGLTPLVKAVRRFFDSHGPWETSPEYYFLREVYKPLELLLAVAACSTLAENILPPVLSIQKDAITGVVRTILSMVFVLSAARVTFSVKGRIFQEAKWRLELRGESTQQRRVEAVDKLLSVLAFIVTSVLGLKALGLDVNSVLAIGGVGGLAVGLAGREIVENLFNGLVIISTSPFNVGDEVQFKPGGQLIEGIVVEIGWYRTIIRSFEREIYVIPNSVFSRTVVLNVTRKQREWRFFQHVPVRVQDLDKVEAIVSDMRRIIRQDPRIIQKLHRRVFLDKLSREEVGIYISFYLEAANRDAYMGIRQNLFLALLDCVKRNGAYLAENKLRLELDPSVPVSMDDKYETSTTTADSNVAIFASDDIQEASVAPTPATGHGPDASRPGESKKSVGVTYAEVSSLPGSPALPGSMP